MQRLRFSRRGHENGQKAAPAPAGSQTPGTLAAALGLDSEGAAPPVTIASDDEWEFVQRVQSRILADPDVPNELHDSNTDYLQQRVVEIVEEFLEHSERVYSEREKQRLCQLARGEILGLGPIEPFLADDSITEIMVNGPEQVWIEREGKLYETQVRFQDHEHVRRIIARIIAPLGRRCDDSSPMVDARLPDGSRVNAIIPPLCLNGPTITIRKFSRTPLSGQDLVERGALTPELLQFLRACVIGHINIVISGGTGVGKTTLLNLLSSFIPDNERIITIENAAELRLQQRHVITLESRPANIEGKGEISIRDLVINALRMRPNRIVIGECRGGEALDMLQAMNTGHDGSMTTIHANGPRDALHRMETMALMAGLDLPQRAVREQIASAIDLIIQLDRFVDGVRRIERVCAVESLQGDIISMADLFVFKHQGLQEGLVQGGLQPTGVRPHFMDRLLQHNVTLPPAVFGFHDS